MENENCEHCGKTVESHYDETGYTACIQSILQTVEAGEVLKQQGMKEENR